MERKLRLNEMTREQIGRVAPDTTVVLPTAATEQHGPHLPIMTDCLCCEAVALRAAERAASDVSVAVAPLLPYGSSHHHLDFPGVMSLRGETFTRALIELCETLSQSGFRRIFLLNGHGGNEEAIRTATREVALSTPATVAAASYWTIAAHSLRGEGQVDAVGPLPGHAGGFETSCVLALRPDLVDTASMPPRREGVALSEESILAARAFIQRPGRWKESRGYSDDASHASAEAGERLLALIVRDVAETLVAFHRSVE